MIAREATCAWRECGKPFLKRRRDHKFCSCWCKRAEWADAHPRPERLQELLEADDPSDPTFSYVEAFQGASSHV